MLEAADGCVSNSAGEQERRCVMDLARQAASNIASEEGWEGDDTVEMYKRLIDEVGTLVSHEDAALLRQVKRLPVGDEVSLMQCRSAFTASHRRKNSRLWTCTADTNLAAALKSALDAAGVPDTKGT